jgi:glycolate oxidase
MQKCIIMDRDTITHLKTIVGAEHLTTAKEDLLSYSYDSSGLEYLPGAVAFPGSSDEISRIMKLACRTSFPVIPRGAGTGMTGGSLAAKGGLVLVLSRFTKIIEIDRENQVAVVEPGVITGQFQAAVRKVGLFYPPDPASLNFCTIGGNVANGAGGPSAVKYGVTRDYVLGLEVVLPDGNIIHTGVRTAKGVVGYDLTRLFVGSEGTLGLITKVTLRLLALPAEKSTFLVLTSSLAQAAKLVAEILNYGILPSTLEYMDKTAILTVADKFPGKLPAATEALLLIEVDGDRSSVEVQCKKLSHFLDSRRASANILEIRQAVDLQEAEALWKARRSISPASFMLRPHKISEDIVVPRSKIPELVKFAEAMGEELGLPILTFGHAGDGNIHVNIMLDKENPQELQKGLEAKNRLFTQVLALTGTLSGEHGVGMTKAPYLSLELEEPSLNIMRRIKHVFDPENILNPGKIFPEA